MDNEKMTDDQFAGLFQAAEEGKRQCIVLFQDADGNWRGAIKNLRGNEDSLFTRAVGPETVLQLLLTHDGKVE